ncbi:MAG: FABP family protein [Actinomycetota bacterium]|nr:FABP family protein [Actinomycetota bacterium]
MAFERCSPELLLERLEGIWRGQGSGSYPEIGEFDYLETMEFTRSPKGFMVYSQHTTSLQGSPMHQELGYMRVDQQHSNLELLIVQPTGIVEVLVGEVMRDGDDFRFDLNSNAVATSPSAKEVVRTGRYFFLENGALSYQLHMEAVGEEYRLHLEASLVRSEGE